MRKRVGPLLNESESTTMNMDQQAGGAQAFDIGNLVATVQGYAKQEKDVLTAVVSGALRGWLQDHDELPASSLIGFCPISVRAGDGSAGSGTGNMFGLQQCPLGTDLADPVARLTLVHRAMAWAKDQVARRGSAATVLLTTPNLVPTLLLSMLPLTPKWRTGTLSPSTALVLRWPASPGHRWATIWCP